MLFKKKKGRKTKEKRKRKQKQPKIIKKGNGDRMRKLQKRFQTQITKYLKKT